MDTGCPLEGYLGSGRHLEQRDATIGRVTYQGATQILNAGAPLVVSRVHNSPEEGACCPLSLGSTLIFFRAEFIRH